MPGENLYQFIFTRKLYERICRLSVLMDISEEKVFEAAIATLEAVQREHIKSKGIPIVPKKPNTKGE